MLSSAAGAGMALAKRAVDGGSNNNNYDLPPWAFLVIILTSLVFLPAFVFIGYSLNSLYTTLAMVEDVNSPAYEPVSLTEDADGAPAGAGGEPKLVTSSLRSINRLLYSVAGWRASFRGIVPAIAIAIATSFVGGIFAAIPFVPSFVGTLLATLALVQLHTAWVHIVISNPSPLPFWKRLPAFKRTFEATCIPVFVFWFATTLASWGPWLVAHAVSLPVWDPRRPHEIPEYQHSMTWKSLIVTLVSLAIAIFAVIPAHVVLVRVQASLLSGDEDTIIPFDRSFQGTVEPAIVDGKGYVTWKDALKTFPRSSWIRLYVLYFKIFLVSVATYIVFAAVMVPEVILMSRKSTETN